MTTIRAIKGMNDILPHAKEPFLHSHVWEHVFEIASRVFAQFGFSPVWFPLVESTELFARSIGTDTDIVGKEMYTFLDRKNRSLTLRPEGTAGAVRAYIEHNLARTDPVQRWWYGGPMFRAERPQKGRYRQFYQIGAELFGSGTPNADVETLLLAWRLCEQLGVGNIQLHINSVGDNESRQCYRQALQQFLSTKESYLCESCRNRLETNPLRVLDCKRDACKNVSQKAPDIIESLTSASRRHFDQVQDGLAAMGVEAKRNPRLVRGLDYYTGTIFEIVTTDLGAQDAVLGGGRYDNLVEHLGGSATPAVGFAAGVERLVWLLCGKPISCTRSELYVIPMPGAEAYALKLADALRSQYAHQVELDVTNLRLKAQMRRADKTKARAVLVIGQREMETGRGSIRNLAKSSDSEVMLDSKSIHEKLMQIDHIKEP